MIRVWGRASSSNVQKVLWALDELDQPFEHRAVGGPYGGTDQPDFTALTPMRRIPVIEDDGFVLWESHAILRYLARLHGGALHRGTPQQTALVDQWMDFSLVHWQPAMTTIFWQLVRLPPSQRSDLLMANAMEDLHQATSVLEGRLTQSPWLAGDRFTIADIAAGTLLYRYFDFEIDRPTRPVLARWYETLQTRAAFRNRVLVSYEELRVS